MLIEGGEKEKKKERKKEKNRKKEEYYRFDSGKRSTCTCTSSSRVCVSDAVRSIDLCASNRIILISVECSSRRMRSDSSRFLACSSPKARSSSCKDVR